LNTAAVASDIDAVPPTLTCLTLRLRGTA